MSKKADRLLLEGQQKYRERDYTSAEDCLSASLTEDPLQSKAWADMALIAAQGDKIHSAVAMTRRAINLALMNSGGIGPEEGIIYSNLGNLLSRVGNQAEAAQAFEDAEEAGLTGWSLHVNKGIMHLTFGEPFKAIEELIRVFEDPEIPQSIIPKVTADLGYAYLMAGEIQKGLPLAAPKWDTPPKEVADLDLPIFEYWNSGPGSIPEGARVLLFHNHGYGDTIQFARFIPQFISEVEKAKGSVAIVAPKPLTKLLSQFTPNVNDTTSDLSKLECDRALPISLLPLWSKTSLETIPQDPYLHIAGDRGSKKTESFNGLKVGVVWAASTGHITGLRRTVPFQELLPLFTLPETKFYGLQASPESEVIKREGAQYLIEDLSPLIEDFYDLACLMEEMDIIVSADTAPLHLAGALGVPTIGLLSRDGADWRWLSHKHVISPWYPGVKLIRQEKVGDWTTPVRVVRHLLEHEADR